MQSGEFEKNFNSLVGDLEASISASLFKNSKLFGSHRGLSHFVCLPSHHLPINKNYSYLDIIVFIFCQFFFAICFSSLFTIVGGMV